MDRSKRQAADLEMTARHRAHWEELRRAQRKLLRLTAQVELPNGQSLVGHTVDISREGVGFRAPFSLDVDEQCTLILTLDTCGVQTLLTLVGRIRHCTREAEDAFRIGMQFVGTDNRAQEVLAAALR
ncbi:MAG: PilZ domain [Burkholderiales bacterium]|jgi:hypothetical protein|nr:PilZ domain [Burkholderiales bacterium]